ncbi:MAG: hypothetical protein K6F23_10550 [Solobacterium sp.]|nr:hypothetical protein [Solobacterium sp.]
MDIVIMKNHFSKRKKLEELEKQIECLYNTAHSPRTDSVWSRKNENSSPVEEALHKIEDAREEYNRLYEDWAEEHNLILDWILKM